MEDLPVFDPASFSRARRRPPGADPELFFGGGGASAWRPWAHAQEVRNDTSNVFLRALYKRLLAEREKRAKRKPAGTPASIVSSIKRTRLDLGPDTPPSAPGLQPRRLVGADEKKKE